MCLRVILIIQVGNPHTGFDLSTGRKGDAKLYSIIEGTVVSRSWISGNQVYVERDDGVTVGYGHMDQPALVNIGDRVVQGQHLGYEGTTGNSTGYHVHVEIHDSNNNRMNPATFMGIPNIFDDYATQYIYDGTPVEPTDPIDPDERTKRNNYKKYFLLMSKKIVINR